MRHRLAVLALLLSLGAVSLRAQVIGTQYVNAQGSDCTTVGACATFQLTNSPSATIQVSGSFSGTLTFETTSDGVTWVATAVQSLADGTSTTTTTGNGQWSFTNVGALQIRARASSWSSGTARISGTRGWSTARVNFGGGGGGGDVSSNTSSSVDNTIALFSGTGGKTIKLATTTGVLKATSGVIAAAVSGTDYAPATTGTSILKGNGSGAFANASAGTDYALNAFASIPVSGQTTVTAASPTQAVTLVAGTNVTLTTDNTAKSITIAASGGGGGGTQLSSAYTTKTANYTLAYASDGTVEGLINAFTLTLPTAVSHSGIQFQVKNLQTANAVTVNTTSAQTIDGASSVSLVNGCLTVQSDNANWRIVGACGLPISGLNSGSLIYSPTTSTVATTGTGLTYDGTSALALGTSGTSVGKVALSNATSGSVTLQPTTGALGSAVATFPAQSGTVAFTTGSTFTTGTISLPFPVMFVAGVNQAGTASIACSQPSSGGASAVAAATSVPPVGVASFSGSASNEIDCHFPLPSDWTASSAFDITLTWRSAATTGNVVWQVATLFVDDGVVLNTAYNTASTVTDAAKATTLQLNRTSITAVTASGTTTPAASKEMFVQVLRNGGAGSDTMTGTAELVSFTITLRRTVTIGG